ncbi:MAG: CRISPR-associated protein Cas4 [Candidatus Aramenus sulfurataquae]|jgi:CRISPR-associated exonuclease Cas4|uniref:CRISPR-associated exonuclease Cas4 n=2 Tax=Candidatus Aramenus sulfurataquae TaxID=1326980 RepID=W7KMI1_9CREN|nr:MAG: CRISPR-associated protein Cas4 [Candidatus Aramenus sulfurataquae]MCL7343182.1 CRISPR-associated protein Cas4 [Candidatus Aramenus sulfurataquae]
MIVELLAKMKLQDFLAHQREENTFYVTDLVRCPLKTEYEKKYREVAVSQALTPATILGELVHRGLESVIQIEGYNVRSEVEAEKVISVGKEVKIKGRCDIMLEKDGERTIVEIKSSRSDAGIPHTHHVMQLRIYLWLFNAKKGILFYVTPDRFTEYEVNEPMDEASIVNLVQQTLDKNPSPRFQWECKYCQFSIMCPNKR